MLYGPHNISDKVYEVLPLWECEIDPVTNIEVCRVSDDYVYYGLCIVLFFVVFVVSYFIFKWSRTKTFLRSDGTVNTTKVMWYSLGLASIVTVCAAIVSSKK